MREGKEKKMVREGEEETDQGVKLFSSVTSLLDFTLI